MDYFEVHLKEGTMRLPSNSRLRERGIAAIMFTLMFMTLVVPLVGLAIDLSMLYMVQSKLSAAVDGAALGAGRLLGTNADTEEIANEFLKANFQSGYWGTYNLAPAPPNTKFATYTIAFNTQTIDVAAQVQVPLLFMRILGYDHTTVSASGTATRKNTRVVLVIDRSGSMSGLLATLADKANYFINHFTPNTDELGLVVFGTSAIVGYPKYTDAGQRPYNLSPTDTTGGPDTGFLTSNSPEAGPMYDQIKAMVAGGNTGMSEALSLAYIELQKAHVRDLKASPTCTDIRLNAIVLFTDGVPNQLAAYLNDPSNNSLKSTTKCSNYPAKSTDRTTQMIGSIGYLNDLYQLASQDTTMATNPWTTWWVKNPGGQGSPAKMNYDLAPIDPSTPLANCTGSIVSGTNLRQIPSQDLYGNSTNGTAYKNSTVVYKSKTGNYSNTTFDAYDLTIAAWNAVYNAATNIRTDAYYDTKRTGVACDSSMPTQLFVIGYTGNGGIDSVLLQSIANDPRYPYYTAGQAQGKFYSASDANAIDEAFNDVASQLLRLAK
jgi:Flp pilus assembly protein TadG